MIASKYNFFFQILMLGFSSCGGSSDETLCLNGSSTGSNSYACHIMLKDNSGRDSVLIVKFGRDYRTSQYLFYDMKGVVKRVETRKNGKFWGNQLTFSDTGELYENIQILPNVDSIKANQTWVYDSLGQLRGGRHIDFVSVLQDTAHLTDQYLSSFSVADMPFDSRVSIRGLDSCPEEPCSLSIVSNNHASRKLVFPDTGNYIVRYQFMQPNDSNLKSKWAQGSDILNFQKKIVVIK